MIKNLKKKKILKTGYLYFDYLRNNITKNFDNNTVLLAPSWSKHYKNFINEKFNKIIDFLLDKNFNVIFRPHPEHYKRSFKYLEFLKDKYCSKNFKLDYDASTINSFNKSSILITDFSGIALEFSLICNRTSIYISDNNSKHGNSDEINYLEVDFKKKFSQTLSLENFFLYFDNIHKNTILNKDQLDNFANSYFYNYENSISKITARELISL